MTYFIRKIHVALTLLLITSLGYAYGDDITLSECTGGKNCDPCQPVCCGQGLLSAELLYWRAFEGGLDRCVSSSTSNQVTSEGNVHSRLRRRDCDPHFTWNPGFRIGYELMCSDWSFGASWTHLHSNSHGSKNKGNAHRSHGSKNKGNAHRWSINFDVIDIVAGYKSSGACFSLRPFIGLRGASIDQKLRVGKEECHCSRRSRRSSRTNDLITFHQNNKQEFAGIGPLIGLEAGWNMGCGFSLYTSADISWLYGNFNVRLRGTNRSVDAFNFYRIRKHLDASLAVADAALGIRWQTCFFESMRLILQLGLEHHRYFDYNRFGNYRNWSFDRFGDYGDLSFDGVNFAVGIEF
jgi:hypothetical protein